MRWKGEWESEGRGRERQRAFTSAVLRSDRSSLMRFMSSFLMCLGDCPTSCLAYSVCVQKLVDAVYWKSNKAVQTTVEDMQGPLWEERHQHPATNWFEVSMPNSHGLRLMFLWTTQSFWLVVFQSLSELQVWTGQVKPWVYQKEDLTGTWQQMLVSESAPSVLLCIQLSPTAIKMIILPLEIIIIKNKEQLSWNHLNLWIFQIQRNNHVPKKSWIKCLVNIQCFLCILTWYLQMYCVHHGAFVKLVTTLNN